TDQISSPEHWSFYSSVLSICSKQLLHPCLQYFSVRYHLTLRRRYRPDAATSRSKRKIFVRIRLRQLLNITHDTYLPLYFRPKKQKTDLIVCRDAIALITVIVRCKTKTFWLDIFQQNHPTRRKTIFAHRGQHHRIGFDNFRMTRVSKPTLKLLDGIG